MKISFGGIASYWLSLALGLCLALGCQQEKKQANDGGNNAGSSNESSETGDKEAEEVIDTNSGGRHFYTGYDGKNDYSLLLPGFREYTIEDSSIAKIKKETVTLSEETISELISEVKKTNDKFDEAAEKRFRERLGRQQSAYRITPLKSGKTTLHTSRGNRGGRDSWGENDVGITLVVNKYTPSQYDAGKERYTTERSGLLKACKSCHETGAEDAPPHELGNIKEISDSQGLQWITTGKLNSRVAKITHTWEFNSDEEEAGILPYLRAKASKDLETFTKLVFEERFQNFKLPPAGETPPG